MNENEAAVEFEDYDNPAIEHIIQGDASRDGRGRPIISYNQYLEMSKLGHRMDDYMLRFRHPSGVIRLGQATKFLKFYGLGWRPVGHGAKVSPPTEAVTIFRCNEKYPECSRFFDSQRGRETHWGAFHEGKFGKKNA